MVPVPDDPPRPNCPEPADPKEFEDPDDPDDPKEEDSDCKEAEVTEESELLPEPGIQTPLIKLYPGSQELQIPLTTSPDEQCGVNAVHTPFFMK